MVHLPWGGMPRRKDHVHGHEGTNTRVKVVNVAESSPPPPPLSPLLLHLLVLFPLLLCFHLRQHHSEAVLVVIGLHAVAFAPAALEDAAAARRTRGDLLLPPNALPVEVLLEVRMQGVRFPPPLHALHRRGIVSIRAFVDVGAFFSAPSACTFASSFINDAVTSSSSISSFANYGALPMSSSERPFSTSTGATTPTLPLTMLACSGIIIPRSEIPIIVFAVADTGPS